MLYAIIAAVGVGMCVKGFERRETLICAGIAVALTLIYFLRPSYMT
jgi:hypothetical protein